MSHHVSGPSGRCGPSGLRALVAALALAALIGPYLRAADAAATKQTDVVSYDNHKVLRVVPSTQTQVSTLSRLANRGDLDVWTKSRELFTPWDIMVSPLSAVEVKRTLEENQLQWKVLIPDVGSTLAGNAATSATSTQGRAGRGMASKWSAIADNPRYLRHKEVMDYLEDLAKQYPDMVMTKSIGKSSEGRDLKVIHISTGRQQGAEDKKGKSKGKVKDSGKPAIWIDAGIHAREWIAPATALYIIRQLVENSTYTANLTSDVDWYILPLMNPDGYEYSHTTDRLWRKTRSKTWWGLGCAGADLNRNFDFHWREVGASWAACSSTYAGSKAFSEPESRAVKDFLLALKDDIRMYLTYHSYGNFLLYPWGYTSTLPSDWQTLDDLATTANAAMVEAGSEPYSIGSSTNVLYAAAGGSDDWAKGIAGIQLSYTIELPGGNGHGFDLPPSYIPEVGRHQMQLINVFASHVAMLTERKNV